MLRTGCFSFLISFLKQIAYRLTYPPQNLGAHVTYTDVLLGARSQVSQKFLNHYVIVNAEAEHEEILSGPTWMLYCAMCTR